MGNPYSRFQKQAKVPVAPGNCFLCGNVDGPYVDTGKSIPWEGAIFICQNCIVEMHGQLDLPQPDPILVEVPVSPEAYSNILLSEIKEYVTNRLNGSSVNLPSVDLDFTVDLSSTPPDGKVEGSSDKSKSDDGENVIGSSNDDASDGESSKSGNKSTRKSGRSDVSSTTSDDTVSSLAY